MPEAYAPCMTRKRLSSSPAAGFEVMPYASLVDTSVTVGTSGLCNEVVQSSSTNRDSLERDFRLSKQKCEASVHWQFSGQPSGVDHSFPELHRMMKSAAVVGALCTCLLQKK